MKQVIQHYRSGELRVEEVPVPGVSPGRVRVQNRFSVVSVGTERAMIELARKSLLGKARERPDLVRKVLDKARAEGLVTAVQQAFRRLDTPKPLGYSSAGVVIETGAGVEGFRPGDRVACAGAGYASHAEVVSVPRNLCVRVPETVDLRDAAFTTLGAIALQGVRISGAGLGEKVAVIGLGLLGQITVQILRAAGCRVLGIDIEDWKLDLARELGAEETVHRKAEDLPARVASFTGQRGVDAVIVTASSRSSDPLHLAGEIARDRATVAVVGVVAMEIPHKVYYEKELRVRMSRSYGPGRYDPAYEEQGRDYPVGFVRWTENRNMEAVLDLVARGQLDFRRLVTDEFPIADAERAYEKVTADPPGRTLGILLTYPEERPLGQRVDLGAGRTKPRAGDIGVGVIGAGQYAMGTLLPALAGVQGVRLRGLAAAGGVSARKAGDKFGFAYSTTDYAEVLGDPEVQAVLILTRNRLHAPLATEALAAGKAVFVEKPLAVSEEQLRPLVAAWRASAEKRLLVGFNRRHAPFTRQILKFWEGVKEPGIGLCRVNAGALPAGFWLLDESEGGGRLVGEACHFIDLLQLLFGSPVTEVTARSLVGEGTGPREDVVVTLAFENGSVGTVLYTTVGDRSFSKERVEVFRGGSVAVVEDFRRLTLTRAGKTRRSVARLGQDKGHRAELEVFFDGLRTGAPYPGTFEDDLRVTLATFAARRSLETGMPFPVDLTSVLPDA